MPLPPDVDEIQAPRWHVLLDAVRNVPADQAVIPDWKLKPELGIYSPTPQYAPMHYIEPRPYYTTNHFIKRKMKKFYKKLEIKRMEEEGVKLRYLPDPKDRLTLAGSELRHGGGVFKAEKELWKALRKMSTNELLESIGDQSTTRLNLESKLVMPNWRPGFQTVAIRDLKNYLKRVDVVLEVRDARCPWATRHPDIPKWVCPKPRVICLTKADLVPRQCLEEAIAYIQQSEKDRGIPVVAVNAFQGGKTIEDLRLELMKAGAFVNRRRRLKNISPRAIRTIIIGYPNVGKSSIINRITGRKVAPKTNWAGTTRRLTWHHIGGFRNTELAFLDCPGLIPVCFGKRSTEETAKLLCMTRTFGDKIIDRHQTAFDLIYHLGRLAKDHPQMVERTVWRETQRKYGVDFQAALRLEGPILPNFVPAHNPEPFCGKLLNDFNQGYWGKIMLERPPSEKHQKQDWSKTLGGGRRGQPALKERVLGELPEPRPEVTFKQGAEGERVREKVPIPAEESTGLFDGW